MKTYRRSPKKEGCYLRESMAPIKPFNQDCQRCRDLVDKIWSNGRVTSNGIRVTSNGILKEVVKRITLSMKCFFYQSDGQPKAEAGFPSNLCHRVSEQGWIILNEKAPVKKQTLKWRDSHGR